MFPLDCLKADLIARVERFAVIREVWASTGRVGHDTVAHDRVRRRRQHDVVCIVRAPCPTPHVPLRRPASSVLVLLYAHAEYRLP
jgi:hypothetical protein